MTTLRPLTLSFSSRKPRLRGGSRPVGICPFPAGFQPPVLGRVGTSGRIRRGATLGGGPGVGMGLDPGKRRARERKERSWELHPQACCFLCVSRRD